MKKHPRWLLGFLTIVLAVSARPQETAPAASLSLQDCIAQTLKNNIGVAIQILNPELANAGVALAKEKWLPTFTLNANRQSSTSVSYSFIDASGSIVNKTNNYSFSATQSVPFGGTFTLSATGYETNSNQNYQTINPRFSANIRFSFTQPLLRNFGYNISQYSILVARDNFSVSETQLKQSLMDTVYQVETSYLTLIYSIENLKVGEQALSLAKDLLEMNKRMIEVGTLAPTEQLTAQAEVATREADLIQFKAQVESASDQLKVLINMPEQEQRAVGTIVPKDSLSYEERTVPLDEALASALEYRPDLASDKLNIHLQQLNMSYTKNQLLPELDLSAYYSGSGVSGTQILYDGNPLLGAPIIGTIPGNFSGAIRDTLKFTYPGWSLGLSLSIPLSNFVSRALYTEAKLTLQQAVLTLQNQQAQVFLEIKNAVRNVEANFKRILAYKVARELAEQKVATEQEKFRVGQSTNYTVLSYQRDLSAARISELNAIVAYNASLAGLDRSMGISLKNKNITFSDYVKK